MFLGRTWMAPRPMEARRILATCGPKAFAAYVGLIAFPVDGYERPRDVILRAYGFVRDGDDALFPAGWTLEGHDLSGRRLLGGWSFNTYEVFVSQDYTTLDVRGRDVVDLGAAWGDTAIYLGLKGAAGVLAVEADAPTYELLRGNLRDWGFGKFEPIQERCLDLGPIVERYGLRSAALKMDVEGDEEELLRRTSLEAMRAFVEVVLEYHRGPSRCERLLRAHGFSIRHRHPFTLTWGRSGILLARRS